MNWLFHIPWDAEPLEHFEWTLSWLGIETTFFLCIGLLITVYRSIKILYARKDTGL